LIIFDNNGSLLQICSVLWTSVMDREIQKVLLWNHGVHYTEDTMSKFPGASRRDGAENISDESCDLDLEDDLIVLQDYSFISISQDSSSFSTHRLVQLAVQVWLQTQGKTEHYKDQFILSLDKVFPKLPSFVNQNKCGSFFPHLESAIQQEPRPKSDESTQMWADILCRGTLHAQHTGHFRDAIDMAFKSKILRQDLLGDDHPDTLHSALTLAQAHGLAGQVAEPVKLRKSCVGLRRLWI
jgi:hypothetical protein